MELLQKKYTEEEARILSPLVLAFIGDAAFEVIVRSYVIKNYENLTVHNLHLKAINYVKNHSQSEYIKKIENILTEQELYMFKRGRNAHSGTIPKNADVIEYRTATGFETVIGFLYLTGNTERIMELLMPLFN